MNNYQVTKQLLLDAKPVAEEIEARFGLYLLPPDCGLYLPTSLQPVMRAHEQYYQLMPVEGNLPTVEKIHVQADIKGAVYNLDAERVVPAGQVKRLSAQPQLPVRGLQVVFAAVDHTLRQHAAWAKKPVGHCGAFLAEYLKEDYHQCLPEDEADLEFLRRKGYPLQRLQRNSELREQLTDALVEIREQVRQFIGQDRWVMHFHYAQGLDIVVDKTIDFRIFDWERRMASGGWT